MSETLPGNKRLLITWLLLMALTLLSMCLAELNSLQAWLPLPLWRTLLVLAAGGFKAHQILMIYLNLRASSAGWKNSFIYLLLTILLLIFLAYLVAPLK